LLEFLAVDNCPPMIRDVPGHVGWFFENEGVRNKLIEAYDIKAVQSDLYDHLGDIYIENVVGVYQAQKQKLFFTPHSVASLLAKMTMHDNKKEQPSVLDPAVGTGRLLMAAYEYCPGARLYGVDNSLTMIKTAFTNAAIHSISMYLLHADSLYHVTDIALPEGRYNWQYANRWQSQMDKLKTYADLKQPEPRDMKDLPKLSSKQEQFKLF
jgi:type I restriction-modification system DNA methylase subunit